MNDKTQKSGLNAGKRKKKKKDKELLLRYVEVVPEFHILLGWEEIQRRIPGLRNMQATRRLARKYGMPLVRIQRRPAISTTMLKEWWDRLVLKRLEEQAKVGDEPHEDLKTVCDSGKRL